MPRNYPRIPIRRDADTKARPGDADFRTDYDAERGGYYPPGEHSGTYGNDSSSGSDSSGGWVD